jgi:hypothetical protein
MKHPSTVSRVLTISILAALALPSATMAATTQQSFDQAMESVRTFLPLHVDGELTLNMTTRALTKDGDVGTGSVHMSLSERVLSRDTANPQSEGRFSVDKADITKTKLVGEPAIHLDQPISIQWKNVGAIAYVRIEQLPASITDALSTLKIDLSPVLGQWISIDTKTVVDQLMGGLPLSGAGTSALNAGSLSDLQSLAKQSALRVTRVEKRWTGADGHQLMRLRLRVNPTIVTTLWRAELKKVASDDPFRAMTIKDINKRFGKLRSLVAGTQIAANIDVTAGTLLRLEFGGTTSNPNQTCTWNTRLDRDVCKNTSVTVVRYSAGLSFQKDIGLSVEAPTGAITMEELIKKLTPPEASTSTEPVPELTPTEVTTTTVTP